MEDQYPISNEVDLMRCLELVIDQHLEEWGYADGEQIQDGDANAVERAVKWLAAKYRR